MKKYITVAALLAAGTAFANAEVVAVFNCGGNNGGRDAWMDTTQGWTRATLGTSGGSFDVTASGSDITLSSTTSTGVFSSTGPGGSFTAGNNTDNNGPYAIPEALETDDVHAGRPQGEHGLHGLPVQRPREQREQQWRRIRDVDDEYGRRELVGLDDRRLRLRGGKVRFHGSGRRVHDR